MENDEVVNESNETVANELDLMSSVFNADYASQDSDSVEESGQDLEEEPITESEQEPEPEPEPEPDPITALKEEINELKAKLEQRRTEPEKPTELVIDDQDFISGVDIDEISSDPQKLNSLLNSVYKLAVKQTSKHIGEDLLKSIPSIVRTNLAVMENLKEASKEFYKANPDLVPYKKTVALVFEELSSKNPDRNYIDLIKLTGEEARKKLGIEKKSAMLSKSKMPALPKKTTQVRSDQNQKVDPLQSEIDLMNKSLF